MPPGFAHRAAPLLLLVATACAHRVVVPPPPATLPRAPDLANVDLYFAEFSVDGDAIVDDEVRSSELQTSFIHYLVAANQVHSVRPFRLDDRLDPDRSLVLHVQVQAYHSTGRTVVLDMANVVLFGLAVPVWGDATVEVDMTLSDARGNPLATYHRKTFDQYWNVLFSWWRTQYVEDAYVDAYEAVFASLAYEMAQDGPRLAKALSAPTPDVDVQVVDATGDWQSETDGAASWSHMWERQLPDPIPLEEQFRLIREAAPPAVAATWYQVLRVLGGVEVGTMYGFARVSSSIEDELGGKIEVGAGAATQTGYRIALYSAPDSTGWFWYPTVGYLSQNIAISGFRDYLSEQPNPDIIQPSCTDPATGERLDCGTPSTYDLQMRSGYLGVRGGYELLAGNKWVQFLGSFGLGVNLVEYRSLRSVVGDDDAKRNGFGGLVSGALGGTMGLKFPTIHTAVRFIFDYEYYRSFRYGHPIPFKGPAEWNSDTQMYDRPLRFVTAASLGSWSLQGALAFVF